MEVEIRKERQNQLLRRKEVFFRLKHGAEGVSPSRVEARDALIKTLKCSPNLLVIDKMGTEFGTRETVGYAKVYEREERLKEVERGHIIERNFGVVQDQGQAKRRAKVKSTSQEKAREK